MSTFGESRTSGWRPWGDVLSINPRPTRMHELLDIDTFQPFEFRGTMYYLDGVGRVQQIEDSWTSTKELRALPLVDPDILSAIINEPDLIWRTRIVDHVSIMRHLKALGMKYIFRRPSIDGIYLFQAPTEGTTLEDLFGWPSGTLKEKCDLYVPGDASLKRDLSIIICNIPFKEIAWRDGTFSYAYDIDKYLKYHGDAKPIYERVM